MHVGWNRNAKNTRKRNVFDEFLRSGRPAKAPKAVWTRTLAREAPKMRFGSLKARSRLAPKFQKRAKTRGFCNVAKKGK